MYRSLLLILFTALPIFTQTPGRDQVETTHNDPSDPIAWYKLGLKLGEASDFRGAERCFQKALELKPDFAQAHYGLALTLTADPGEKLDWNGAIIQCREALKINPDYPEALTLLGEGLIKTGESAAAIPPLRSAIRLHPDSAEAHLALGEALDANSQPQDALQEYRAAVSLRPDNARSETALAKLLFHTGDLAEAKARFLQALRADPDSTDAHYGLARLYQSAHQPREAALEFDQAKDLASREPNALRSSQLSNQGLELAAKRDWTDAISTLREAIALKPDYGVPHYNLGLVLADSGDLTGATRELIKASSLLPDQPKPWFSLGRVQHAQGDLDGARYSLNRALALSPSDPAFRAEFDSIQAAAPNAKSTYKVNSEAYGPASNTALEHLAFARLLASRGDDSGAVGELLRSLSLNPGSVEARRDLAEAYARLGDSPHSALEELKLNILAAKEAVPKQLPAGPPNSK